MRAVLQRVKRASVTIKQNVKARIEHGMVVLLGIEDSDGKEDIDYLTKKIANLRIFDDENGVMNRSITDTEGGIIVVSQFTLMASTKKGNRPSYLRASKPETAVPLYESFCTEMEITFGKQIQTGEFGAEMEVEIINDGPVTIIIDSKNRE